MTPDGLKLTGKPFSLLRDDERVGMEGQHWFKKNGYYYLIYAINGCCGPNMRLCAWLSPARRSSKGLMKGSYGKSDPARERRATIYRSWHTDDDA
ncbi:MAG: hypothetical protein ACLRS8_16225 [Parabacteroides merdae]